MPFVDFPTRTCEQAKMFSQCPDSGFCRNPNVCSVSKRCYTQEKYERACND